METFNLCCISGAFHPRSVSSVLCHYQFVYVYKVKLFLLENIVCLLVLALKQPVIMRAVLFNAISICLVCVDLPHTGHAYSATKKHRASAVILIVLG